MPLCLVNSILNFGAKVTSLPFFLYYKLNKSLWLLFFILVISWFFGSVFSLFLEQQTIVLSTYAFIGMLGGNYEPFLHLTQLSTTNLVLVLFIDLFLNLTSLILRNGLLALILFELSDSIRNKLRPPSVEPIVTNKAFKTLF